MGSGSPYSSALRLSNLEVISAWIRVAAESLVRYFLMQLGKSTLVNKMVLRPSFGEHCTKEVVYVTEHHQSTHIGSDCRSRIGPNLVPSQ